MIPTKAVRLFRTILGLRDEVYMLLGAINLSAQMEVVFWDMRDIAFLDPLTQAFGTMTYKFRSLSIICVRPSVRSPS